MQLQRIFVLAATSASLLAGTAAFAADMVTYEPAPMPPPAPERFDWSGPYIGIFGGLAAGDTEYTVTSLAAQPPPPFVADISSSGFLGGIQAGWDWQRGNFVFGVVADIAATSYGPSISVSGPGFDADIESNLNYLGTVRGRIGHAMDRTLLYAHGGFAYGQTEQDITVGGATLFNEEQGRTGWTVGAGFEFAVTQRLSLGAEYAYVDLGTEEIFSGTIPGVVTRVSIEEEMKFHTLKAMLNFRF